MNPPLPRPLSASAFPGSADLVSGIDWRNMSETEHFVQLYETDAYLVEAVSAYLLAGFSANGAGIVIGTKPHMLAIEERLQARGLDVAALKATGQLRTLDADETLSRFMVDGHPDRELFFATLGGVVARAAEGGRQVRAFGEMVASLWADGQQQAALELEQLWNELAQFQKFALFCAYPLQGLGGDENSRPFLHVCQAHTRVIPAESYVTQPTTVERWRCVSALQQKASSLASEVASRKQAELVSREEHLKLSMAVAIAELGIWELDVATRDLELSEQCRVQLGIAGAARVTLQELLEHVHPADRGIVQATLLGAIASRSDYAAEFRVPRAGGDIRWLSATGRHVSEGRPRLLGAMLDITARRTTTATLEAMVADRTRELREALAELEAFAYSMSHDLRTPLRAMRSYAEILLQECGGDLSAHGRHYLDRITMSATRMDRLVQDILAFSRLTGTEFTAEPVDLDRVLRAVVDNARVSTPSATIIIDGTPPWVSANTTALTQCISNLVDNAVKFVASGVVPEVRIWTESFARDGEDWVRLNVRDNGIGIPAAARERIFEVFQRVGERSYEGAGLGLAIVQKAMTRMGGTVGVDSEPGKGSVFWLDLKRAGPGAPGR